MKRKAIVCILLALVLTLTALAACNTEHTASDTYFSDETHHWHGCKACDEHTFDKAPHQFVDDGTQKKCSICGKTVQSVDDDTEHVASDAYFSDETYHWHGCKACDEHTFDKAPHQFADDGVQKKCPVCGKTAQYSDEDNALYWIAGRDGTLSVSGNYYVKHTEENSYAGEKYRTVSSESWDGNDRYYYVRNAYEADENGKLTQTDEEITAFKPAVNGNISCGMLFRLGYDDDGNLERRAYYVSPDYVDEDFVGYAPASMLEDYGIEGGTDLTSLVAGIKAFCIEDMGIEPTITFTKNSDGSVTLKIECVYETQDAEEENCTVKGRIALSLTAKDGKIVRTEDNLYSENIYADSTKNYAESTVRVTEFEYEFNQAEFEKIDTTTTDEPVNDFYSFFTIEEVEFGQWFYYDESLVGETVTADMIHSSIVSDIGKFVGNFDGIKVIELYTDKQLTKPFVSVQTDKEEYTLYAKFVAPQDKSLVLTVFEKTEEGKKVEALRIAYLMEAGKRFYPRYSFPNYPLLTVDGVAPESYSSFVCEGGKVHIVKYVDDWHDEPIEFVHGALPEWKYNEQAHWHECNECNMEQFDWGVHDFTIKNGNNECKYCGYTVEITEEENFADFIKARNRSISYDGDYYVKMLQNTFDAATNELVEKSVREETLSGNRYVNKDYFEVLMGNQMRTFQTIKAVVLVQIENQLRLKQIQITTNMDYTTSQGALKKPSFSADEMAYLTPETWFAGLCIDVEATTFNEFKTKFIAAYNEYYSAFNNTVTDVKLKRNDDGTVSLLFTAGGEYVDDNISQEGYQKSKYVCKYEIVTDDYGIISCKTDNRYTYCYDSGDQTDYVEQIDTYEYRFNQDLYDSVPTETDTTVDEFVSYVEFYVNGYSYLYSMKVAINNELSLLDAQTFLARVDIDGYQPLFASSVDPSMLAVYTDEAMTQEFTGLTATEENYTLYAKLIVPEDKAIIIGLREYGDHRAIDLCYLKNVGASFDTSILQKTYPLIEVDGVQITDGSTPTLVCSESRIYTVVCKVR